MKLRPSNSFNGGIKTNSNNNQHIMKLEVTSSVLELSNLKKLKIILHL